MAQPPSIPSVSELGQAIATPNDWRAIVIVMAFVILALIGFIVWREFSLVGLRKSIDKLSEAIWLMRLTMVEKGIKERDEHGDGIR